MGALAVIALPLWLAVPGLSLTDACFQATPALTATGATAITGLDPLPLAGAYLPMRCCNAEVQAFVGALAGSIALIPGCLWFDGACAGYPEALRHTAVHVVSTVTTNGHASHDHAQCPPRCTPAARPAARAKKTGPAGGPE